MGSISVYGSQYFAKTMFGQTMSPLSTYYVALITGADPSGFITGAELEEPTGGGYSRLSVANTSAEWIETDFGKMVNNHDLYWTAATADWGRVRSWAVCDAATNGNIISFGQFLTSRWVANGDRFWISNGGIQFTFLAGL